MRCVLPIDGSATEGLPLGLEASRPCTAAWATAHLLLRVLNHPAEGGLVGGAAAYACSGAGSDGELHKDEKETKKVTFSESIIIMLLSLKVTAATLLSSSAQQYLAAGNARDLLELLLLLPVANQCTYTSSCVVVLSHVSCTLSVIATS